MIRVDCHIRASRRHGAQPEGRIPGRKGPKPISRRTLFLGDVEGERQVLERLLARLSITRLDRVIFLGDTIDRGPDSKGVLELIYNLSAHVGELICLRGNHEDKHIRYAQARRARDQGRLRSFELPEYFLEVHHTLSEEHLDWLAQQPLYYRTDQWLAVHAGVAPDVALPEGVYELHREDDAYNPSMRKMMNLRYLQPGSLKSINVGEERRDSIYWAELYDGRYGLVIYGHDPQLEVTRYPHAIAVDTTRETGGALSCLEMSAAGEPLSVTTCMKDGLTVHQLPPPTLQGDAASRGRRRLYPPDQFPA